MMEIAHAVKSIQPLTGRNDSLSHCFNLVSPQIFHTQGQAVVSCALTDTLQESSEFLFSHANKWAACEL